MRIRWNKKKFESGEVDEKTITSDEKRWINHIEYLKFARRLQREKIADFGCSEDEIETKRGLNGFLSKLLVHNSLKKENIDESRLRNGDEDYWQEVKKKIKEPIKLWYKILSFNQYIIKIFYINLWTDKNYLLLF